MNAKFFSKKAVKYTDDHGDSPEYCKICGHFRGTKSCRILFDFGPVDPQGWCMKFYYTINSPLKPFMFRGEGLI